ncbi:MAG: tetratricopeptide repeat protein [Planctomycetaceae bacterium]|jgi:cellulose synthase operon protein C|nr:tetratricopeptide repeat protein [Planctomycetaceae bacterium]MBT6486404.1 tetratricopeptide repeat protein [Planctomycetaceae bacterium]
MYSLTANHPPQPIWRSARCRIGRWTIGLLFVLILALVVPQSARADEALDEYNLATGQYKLKRWDQAAERFRAFIKNHTGNVKIPLARLYLGLTLVHQKKYGDSRTVLRGFVKDYPQSKHRPDAMYRIGECSYFLGDLKAAAQEFSTFLKTYPKNELAEWATPYLADAYRRAKQPQEAADIYLQALKKYPNSRFTEESTFGLARCYESLKQPDDAIAMFGKVAAMKNGTRAAEAQMAVASVQFDAGRFRDAAGSYEQFIARYPESDLLPQAEINAGYAHYQAGDFQRAVSHFDRAAKDKGQQATAGYWMGVSRKALRQYAEASRDLEAAFKADENGPLAQNALFQWADTEFHREQYNTARTRFLDVVKRWPKGDLADDSLHLAAEAALNEGKLDDGDRLVSQFRKEYSNSALRMYNRILGGRLASARGGEKHLKVAADHFRGVVEASKIPRTRSLARFHLARTLQQLDDDDGVLEVAAPLLDDIAKEGASLEFIDVLIIASSSQLTLKKYGDAVTSTSRYLKSRPEGSQANQALATRAIAAAYLDDKTDSQADLTRLTRATTASKLAQQTTYKIAEIAYDLKDWEWSADLYGRLVARGPKSPNHAHALSGLGWCRFEQKKFLDAADHFTQLIEQHPGETVLAPEAAFKRAESLENADRFPEAAKAYGESFSKFAPKETPPNGAEQKPPLQYAFLSGLNQARVLRSLKNVKEADAAYEQLLERFPNPAALDKRLDEWALLNYDAGNYKRSDEIFARLVKESPDSDLADNARLSLAESDLLAGRIADARKSFDRLQQDVRSDKQVQEVSLHHLIGIAVEEERWKDVSSRTTAFLGRFAESKQAPHARFQSANALLNQKQHKAAQETLLKLKTDFEKTSPDDQPWVPQIWIMLAETHFRGKKYAEVTAVVSELRDRDPKCPVLYQADEILGRSYKNLAKFDEARTAFRRVVADPNGRRTETAAKAQLILAETFLLQKDYKNAQAEYFKVYHLYKFPIWQSAALYQAALCDEALKQWNDAAKLYEELLQKFPRSQYARQAKQRLPLARKNAGS